MSKVVDKNWPWYLLASVLFTLGMAGLWLLGRGINQDFGAGFATGLILGLIIAISAVGWRRGEWGPGARE